MVERKDEHRLQHRVAGYHDIRLDGITDILTRAEGMRVLDLGANRGMIALEFARYRAALIHGCDNYEQGMEAAQAAGSHIAAELLADKRYLEAKFAVVDLTKEIPFPGQRYDIVLMIATYHKLKRIMPAGALSKLIQNLAGRTERWFVWRGPSDVAEGMEELAALDRELSLTFDRVQTSTLSKTLGVAAIWERK
jgi:SAM-dependent methyltransferase